MKKIIVKSALERLQGLVERNTLTVDEYQDVLAVVSIYVDEFNHTMWYWPKFIQRWLYKTFLDNIVSAAISIALSVKSEMFLENIRGKID